MKWTFVIEQKVKITLCLFVFAIAILITSLLEKRNMGAINKSFSSIYHDRLIPATDIFYLSERLYGNRLAMEQVLDQPDQKQIDNLKSEVSKNNLVIDSLIGEFEKTYLVSDESKYLAEFKSTVGESRSIQNSVIEKLEKGQHEAANELYQGLGKSKMQRSITVLYELTSIQSAVGKSLISDCKNNVLMSNFLTHLNIGLIIVIMLIIQILIFSSKPLPVKSKNFHLN